MGNEPPSPSPESVPLVQPQETHECAVGYQLEARRYTILFVIALTGASGTLLWLSTSPSSDTLTDYFGVNSTVFQIANGAFYAGSLFGIVLALMVIPRDDFGLRNLMLLAGSLILLGSSIRMFSWFQSPTGFAILCFGNLTAALSAGILISIPAQLALVFFGSREQLTCIGLCLAGVGIGGVTGYILSAVMITDSNDIFMWVMLNTIIFVVALLAFVLNFIFVENEPNSPPSPASCSAAKFKKEFGSCDKFAEGIRKYTHVYFWLMILACTLGVSVYWTIQNTLQTQMDNHGFSRFDQNVSGILFEVMGCIGVVIFSLLVDRYNIIQVGSFVAWCVSLIMFFILGQRVISTWFGTSTAGLYCIAGAAGLAFSALPSMMINLVCQTVFPVPPAYVSISIFFLAQVATLIVLFTTIEVAGSAAWYIMYAILAVATLLSITNLFAPLRRDDAEKQIGLMKKQDESI